MPDKSTIVIIGPAHPLRGGLASFNERLARQFKRSGHRVIVYTFSLQYPGFLFPGTTQYSSEPVPADIDIKVAINSINPLNWLSVGSEICKLKPAIVIVRYWLPFMGPCLGTILRRVKKNKLTKVVCIADNVIPHEKRFGDKSFTKYFIKPVDAFVTMSQKVLADLRLFDKEKPAVFVSHPLYDNFGEPVSKSEARSKLGLSPDQKIILFFGFIRQYKGLDLLLEAMSDERIKAAGIRLVVAGEFYEESQPYLDQIQKLGITETVILKTEFIPDSQVRYYLCAADLVVQPYKNATQSGVTPLAYHFEKPMVVTRVGALPDMVPHEKVGLVAEPNARSLADEILHFYSLGEQWFLPHLKEEKKKYTWDLMEQNIKLLANGVQK
jgi:glycosyltransferase involved in cell wall biosynthesis